MQCDIYITQIETTTFYCIQKRICTKNNQILYIVLTPHFFKKDSDVKIHKGGKLERIVKKFKTLKLYYAQ
jgi:hypothetical protein